MFRFISWIWKFFTPDPIEVKQLPAALYNSSLKPILIDSWRANFQEGAHLAAEFDRLLNDKIEEVINFIIDKSFEELAPRIKLALKYKHQDVCLLGRDTLKEANEQYSSGVADDCINATYVGLRRVVAGAIYHDPRFGKGEVSAGVLYTKIETLLGKKLKSTGLDYSFKEYKDNIIIPLESIKRLVDTEPDYPLISPHFFLPPYR